MRLVRMRLVCCLATVDEDWSAAERLGHILAEHRDEIPANILDPVEDILFDLTRSVRRLLEELELGPSEGKREM